MSEVIDFRVERSRHEHFFGREDVFAEIDRLLSLPRYARGFILLTSGPGVGKSAILSRWLDRCEERTGRRAPHHFLRRGVADWDRAEAIIASLSAQIEALYPAQTEARPKPESRLLNLLGRVSVEILVPSGERLYCVVDGLDEAQVDGTTQNPLYRFLPHILPKGVFFLCSSRPTYPHLRWLEARENLHRIHLDSPPWNASNEQACRAFWAYHAETLVPPLDPILTEQAVQRAQGNLLHAVKLREWLDRVPPEQRRAESIPRGLEGFLSQLWEELRLLPATLFDVATQGLGLLCAAREALPITALAAAAGWTEVRTKDDFLRATSSLLLEEPEHWKGAKAYRPYHESFREFIAAMLGPEAVREHHRRLGETISAWPPADAREPFPRTYALRHAIAHAIEAREHATIEAFARDLGFLEAACREVGATVVEKDIERAVASLPDPARAPEIVMLYRAVRAESHWLRQFPEALPALAYNRLRSAGVRPATIAERLRFPRGLPPLRLRHPVRLGEAVERTLKGHDGKVLACAVTRDGRRVLSGSADRTLKLWDLDTGMCLLTLTGHVGDVEACAVAHDGRRALSASRDTTLALWDIETGACLATLEGHMARVGACALLPDQRRAVSASDDTTLKLWDIESGRALVTFSGHSDWVHACAVHPDGRRLISGSDDRTLKIWDIETGACLATLRGHIDWVRACAVHPDGQRLISGSNDATLKVWDLETGRVLTTLEGHTAGVAGCAVTPDGRRLVTAGNDATLRIWDLRSGQTITTLIGHSAKVGACDVTADGTRAVSAANDRTLKIWSLQEGPSAAEVKAHSVWVDACALTPDGRRLVSASNDRTLKVWDVDTGEVQKTLEGHVDWVRACAVATDGVRVVSASFDTTLKVWDMKTGEVLTTLRGHAHWATACAVFPDGRRALSASDDTTLKVWDLDAGRALFTLEGHTERVRACAVAPDGRRVLSASDDATLKVWDADTGQALMTLAGHGDFVTSCAFTPDGRFAVSSSADHTIRVWDLAKGRALATLTGHTAIVHGCAVTPDGRRVFSASEDHTIRAWSLATGECEATVYGVSPFGCVAVNEDVLCAGDANGNIWMLEMTSPTSAEKARAERGPLRVFYSYARKDEPLRDVLETHLSLLERQGLIESWHDRCVAPGAAWEGVIDENLERADVILLLVSADFIDSDYCYDKEMVRAMERHRAGQTVVVPIIVRPVDWGGAPFARLSALPKGGRPVTLWKNQDEAWVDVTLGIRALVDSR